MSIIIVSGSRHATEDHFYVIEAALLAVSGGNVLRRADDGTKHRLVHGDAPGVDRLADAVVEQWGWDSIPFPADWQRCDGDLPGEAGGCPSRPHLRQGRRGLYCPYAGPRRNQQMIDQYPHADMALAFPGRARGIRSGTGDFMDRAVRAGLQLHVFPLDLSVQAPLFGDARLSPTNA